MSIPCNATQFGGMLMWPNCDRISPVKIGEVQGWARAAVLRCALQRRCVLQRSAEAQGFGMRRSAEAQSFSDPPLRDAALRCSAGFEWPALHRGAAEETKEARSLPFFLFFCVFFLPKFDFFFTNFMLSFLILGHIAVPLQPSAAALVFLSYRCSACDF